jgi:hypothetical protein
MIAYIIHATLIWLVGLLFFELLMRGTTFHKLNRLYLILTVLIGVMLPLYPIHSHVVQIPGVVAYPITATAIIERQIIKNTGRT